MRVPVVNTPLVNIPEAGPRESARLDTRLGAPMQHEAGIGAFSSGVNTWAPIAKGMSDIADADYRVQLRLEDEKARNNARDAYVKLNEAATQYLQGDGGVFTKQGKDALGAVPDAKTWFDKQVATATKGMSKREADLFTQQATGLRVSSMMSVARHEQGQRKAWETRSLATQAEIENKNAVNSFTDERQREDAIFRKESAELELLRKQGMDEATVAEYIGKSTSGTLAGIFGRQVEAKNYDGARKVFDDPRLSEEDKRRVAALYHRARLEDLHVDAVRDPEGVKKRIMAELGMRGNFSGSTGAAGFVAQFESGKDGGAAIGYDKNGGTSYGKFQIASKTGTYDAFLSWMDKSGHTDAAAALRAAGSPDTGGKEGAAPAAWKKLVAEKKITDEMQEQFIRETHVAPALAKAPPELASAMDSDPRIAAAVFSTAVQHGAGGAGKLLTDAWNAAGGATAAGGDAAKFIDALYESRKGQFGSSEAAVQQSVAARLDREKAALLGMEAGADSAASATGAGGETPAGTPSPRHLLDMSPKDQITVLHWAESEIRRRDAEKAATESDDMALQYLSRVQNGEDYDAVHKDILALDPKMRSSVNQLFQAHHRDWQAANKEKADVAIGENVDKMRDMDAGAAYRFAHGLPESTPLERMIKKRALADYGVMAQHGGRSKSTDPARYADLVDAIGHAEIKTETELRAHPYAASVAEGDLKKLLNDIKGASTVTEKSLKTAYRWAIGKDENNPEAGKLTEKENRDFMKFSDWAQKAAARTAKAGDPEYARTLARLWRTEGETKSSYFPGYGRDRKFSEAMDDPTWLPDLKGEHLTAVNRKFEDNPELARRWAAQFSGNMELGKRGYLKLLLQQNLIPAQREQKDPRAYHSE